MAPTGYSLTVELEVTALRRTLRQEGLKFFPAYLWLVTKNLNGDPAFTLAERDGVLGYYDTQTPPPENAYTVSCVPWVRFTHFAVHSYENKPYYFPSVEAGKLTETGGRTLLPLSLTCHHAATDGCHIAAFLDELQDDAEHFSLFL